jgi:hypothetical protein
MYPWFFWNWAPHVQFPYSGPLTQTVEPNTNWFFDAIPSAAGDGKLERQIFDQMSYGRQLGLLTEVLLWMAGSDAVSTARANESIERLKSHYQKSEALKRGHSGSAAEQAIALLEQLRVTDPQELARVLERFRPALPALE